MSPEEAISRISQLKVRPKPDNAKDLCALITAKKALEKQIAIKPGGNRFVGKCICEKTVYPHMLFCDNCGQALDWSKE